MPMRIPLPAHSWNFSGEVDWSVCGHNNMFIDHVPSGLLILIRASTSHLRLGVFARLLQVRCSTTRLRELATPCRSATLSTPARKRRLRWPRRSSCGQRSMTASPAVPPAGWTIRLSGGETFLVSFLPVVVFLTGCNIVLPLSHRSPVFAHSSHHKNKKPLTSNDN